MDLVCIVDFVIEIGFIIVWVCCVDEVWVVVEWLLYFVVQDYYGMMVWMEEMLECC